MDIGSSQLERFHWLAGRLGWVHRTQYRNCWTRSSVHCIRACISTNWCLLQNNRSEDSTLHFQIQRARVVHCTNRLRYALQRQNRSKQLKTIKYGYERQIYFAYSLNRTTVLFLFFTMFYYHQIRRNVKIRLGIVHFDS